MTFNMVDCVYEDIGFGLFLQLWDRKREVR